MENNTLSRFTDAPDYAKFQQEILAFYRKKGRMFPWRTTDDPYAILVSEFMLQQTQTERVVEKYTNWLTAFPSIPALAAASFADVLAYWVGLGYNRRARFLHECAKTIAKQHGGVVPADPAALQKLSGIGPYTAAAVAAFAYNQPTVFIETNIRAVFIHCFFPQASAVGDKEILPHVQASLYKENPRMWYYALMDYGAELKKTVQNPNRKSRHYTRQSKFAGSVRQARGAVVRSLTMHPNQTYAELLAHTQIEEKLFTQGLTALLKEGFIAENSGIYAIGTPT